MKKIFALPASAKSVFSLTKTGFLILFLTQLSFAQIVIEERVEILPEQNNILPSGSISGDSLNPVYLGYGGEVTLNLIHSSNHNLELWEESLGKLTINSITSLGEFPQWHKFIFYLLNPSTGQKYYTDLTTEIVWEYGSSIDFYPSHQPGDPYPYDPEDWWKIDVDVNNAFVTIPPEEILNYLGNPFVPTEPLVVPVDGSLYAFITKVVNKNNTPTDELWMDIPGTQLLQDNIGSHLYGIYDLGHMTAGDPIRFFLRTQNSLVSGMNLYPNQIREETFLPDGDILLWRLQFEDWTDLRFDDVEVEIYFTPDDIGSFPGPVAVTIEPPEIAPGDTAEIIIQRRYLDGTLEDFTQWRSFEIGMIDGCDAGLFLSDGILEPYFEEVYQPVYFVANSNITERDTVVIRAGLVEYFGGRPIFNGGDPDDTDKELRTSMTDKRNLALRKLGKSIKEPEPLPMNPTTSCFGQLITWSSVGDGGVVVGDGDECETYSCDEYFPIVPPPITLEKHLTIDYPNLELCDPIADAFTGAFFRPLFDNILDDIKDELLVPFDVFACFDEDERIWKFKVNNGAGFRLRVIEDLCYSNLERHVLIKNATIDLLNKIPDEKVCQALNDFEDQKRYYRGAVSDGSFIIESAIKNHEEVHEWTFTYFVNKTLDDEFLNDTYDEIMTFNESLSLAKECGELFSNSQNSKSRAKTEYEYVMAEFIEKLKKRHDRFLKNTFSLDGVEYSVSEILAQWNPHVQLEINLYQYNLQMFRDADDCNYKRGKIFEELIYEKILETLGGN